MDFAAVNWASVGFGVMGLCTLVFIACAIRRQWTIAALIVGILHLPMAFVNAAAPFRGALDPTYPGYVQGLVHADRGAEVAIFAFAVLASALACACIAVLNRAGPRNYFIVAFDAFMLLTLIPSTLGGAAENGLASFNVAFGDYLQFGGLPALLFELALLIAPPAIGITWAWKRASATD
ncbi:MAG: hypothetical protein AB7P07_12050 [Hyphomonadaceae bacterium]